MPASLYEEKKSIWTGKFIIIFIINILVNVSMYMVNTLIPKVSSDLQVPVALIGVIVSTYAVTSLIARPFVGVSGSYVRQSTVLRIALGLLIITYALYGLAKDVPLLIAGRLLQGIGMAFVGPLCLSLAANFLPIDRMTSGIAIFSISQAAANAVGPSIGIWIASRFGYLPAFFLPCSFMTVAFALAMTLPADQRHLKRETNLSIYSFVEKDALIPGILFFFLGGTYSCIVSYVVLYGESCGIINCGVFFTSYAVFVMLSRLISGKIGEKFGLSYVIIPAIICYAASFYFISISRSTLMLIIAGAISALGYGVCQPSIQALCMIRVPESRRSVASNTCYLGVDIGYLVMPVISGAIVSNVQNRTGSITQGYISMFRIRPIAILVALVIYIIFRNRLDEKDDCVL